MVLNNVMCTIAKLDNFKKCSKNRCNTSICIEFDKIAINT